MDWNLYNKRINVNGSTQRDRNLNSFKKNIINNISASPSYKDVSISGVKRKLIVNSSNNAKIKNIASLPNETFYLGEIVDFANSKWLIIEADSDKDVYVDGKMQECNYLLKFQDENAKIIETWIVSQNASAYNNGENGNKTLILGSDQLMLTLPFDTDTIKLRRGKRFFIDNNTINPTAYKLTRADTTSYVRDGKGCLNLIVTEDTTNNANDRPDLMLCDYISPTSPPTPTGWVMEIEYLGNPTIKIGGNYKTFTGRLFDNNKVEVAMTPVWTIDKYADSFITTTSGNQIQIKTDNINIAGEIITLKATDSRSNISESIQLTITQL